MIQQPDTATMEGRHQVELASRKFRIQYSDRRPNEHKKWKVTRSDLMLLNWSLFDFQINPEDLQAWSETQVRDVWTIDEEQRLFCNHVLKCVITFPCYNCREIINALNGASASTVISESERLTSIREIDDLKHQIADRDAVIEAEKAAVTIARQEIAEQRRSIAVLEEVVGDYWDEKSTGEKTDPTQPNAVLHVPIVIPGPIEDYRPWTGMEAQAGTVLRWLDSDTTASVTYSNTYWCIVNGVQNDYGRLLQSGWRQLNGDRCGIRIRKEKS